MTNTDIKKFKKAVEILRGNTKPLYIMIKGGILGKLNDNPPLGHWICIHSDCCRRKQCARYLKQPDGLQVNFYAPEKGCQACPYFKPAGQPY